MPVFVRPFNYNYNLDKEKEKFDEFFSDPKRAIPQKKNNEIDLATWNIANLGIQKRDDKDLELIAYIISHFDIIAVQEINARLKSFLNIMEILENNNFDMMITDPAGNQERLAVIYRTDKFKPCQLFGELDYNPNGKIVNNKYVIAPKKQSYSYKGKKTELKFYNFNRNPFLSTWETIHGKISFLLANVHIYYGKKTRDSAEFINRVSEVFYLANWAREQQKKEIGIDLYESNIILIGDMNIPKMESKDSVYRALMRRGMKPNKWATEAGTTIKEFSTFDQIVFTNDKMKVTKIQGQNSVVVDYDNYILNDLYDQYGLKKFKAWTKSAISDHRPLFIRLKIK